jgi:hypothetical protein
MEKKSVRKIKQKKILDNRKAVRKVAKRDSRAVAEMESKASQCLAVARWMFPNANDQIIVDQATELMFLPLTVINSTLDRFREISGPAGAPAHPPPAIYSPYDISSGIINLIEESSVPSLPIEELPVPYLNDVGPSAKKDSVINRYQLLKQNRKDIRNETIN